MRTVYILLKIHITFEMCSPELPPRRKNFLPTYLQEGKSPSPSFQEGNSPPVDFSYPQQEGKFIYDT